MRRQRVVSWVQARKLKSDFYFSIEALTLRGTPLSVGGRRRPTWLIRHIFDTLAREPCKTRRDLKRAVCLYHVWTDEAGVEREFFAHHKNTWSKTGISKKPLCIWCVSRILQNDSSQDQGSEEAMDVFDKDTRTYSHDTKHGQTGGKILYVCQGVCNYSLNLSRVNNSPLTNNMLSFCVWNNSLNPCCTILHWHTACWVFCKNVNAPEIIQAVERKQGAASARTLVGGGCTTWVNSSLR